MFVTVYCPLDKKWRVANGWTGVLLPAERNMRGFKSEKRARKFAAKTHRSAVRLFRSFK